MITVSVTVFIDCLNTFLEIMPLFCEKNTLQHVLHNDEINSNQHYNW